MLLVRLQRNPRFQNDRAVGPPLDRDVALQPFDLAKARLGQYLGCIPTHIASPGIRSFSDPSSLSVLSLDIDRLSLLKKGPDAFAELFRAAAQDLIAVFHRDHRFDRAGIDAHIEAFLR